MNEKIKNTWKYIKEHKLQIALAAATAVGGVVLCKSLIKTPKFETMDILTKPFVGPEKLILPGFDVGVLDDAMRYDNGTVELFLDDIPLSDMGRLGEEIMAYIPELSANDGVWALLNIKPNKVER